MNLSKRINKLLTPNESESSKVRIYKACLFRLKLSRILFFLPCSFFLTLLCYPISHFSKMPSLMQKKVLDLLLLIWSLARTTRIQSWYLLLLLCDKRSSSRKGKTVVPAFKNGRKCICIHSLDGTAVILRSNVLLFSAQGNKKDIILRWGQVYWRVCMCV